MADELYDLPQKKKKKEIKQIFQLIKDLHNTCSQRSCGTRLHVFSKIVGGNFY